MLVHFLVAGIVKLTGIRSKTMSAEELAPVKGKYDQLPEAMFDAVTAEAEAQNLIVRAAELQISATKTWDELAAEADAELNALKDAENVSQADFLHTYEAAMLKLGQRSLRARDFEVVVGLRDQLRPGVIFSAESNSKGLLTIAEPTDASDGRGAIVPVLAESLQAGKLELRWRVPVEERDEPAFISARSLVGKDVIEKYLGEQTKLTWHRSSPAHFDAMRRLAVNYAAIGAEEEAARINEHLTNEITRHLDKDLFGVGSSGVKQIGVPQANLQILHSVDPASHQKFIAKVELFAAIGNFPEAVDIVVRLEADRIAQEKATKQGETHYRRPTELDIARLRVKFVLAGNKASKDSAKKELR